MCHEKYIRNKLASNYRGKFYFVFLANNARWNICSNFEQFSFLSLCKIPFIFSGWLLFITIYCISFRAHG
uniref:Uncharacterized protein n=1 Tax=Octopus bimaculoides TaxID=37653 RepID=A0A0L8H1E1_OCTBM